MGQEPTNSAPFFPEGELWLLYYQNESWLPREDGWETEPQTLKVHPISGAPKPLLEAWASMR